MRNNIFHLPSRFFHLTSKNSSILHLTSYIEVLFHLTSSILHLPSYISWSTQEIYLNETNKVNKALEGRRHTGRGGTPDSNEIEEGMNGYSLLVIVY